MPVSARAAEPAGASGHVCQKPSACAPPSGASLSQDCDVRYRDLSLQYSGNSSCERAIRRCGQNCGQIRSYEGSRSGEAIRHITTPLKSLIAEYTPHLFYSLNMDELDEAKKEALRNVYRGTPGSSRDVFAMPGGGGAGASTGLKLASCVNQIETPSKPQTPAEKAMFGRLKIDNCTNQYILQSAVDPAYKENVRTYSMENANDPTQRINLASHCQPLTMRPSGDQTMNEYDAGLYLQGAWKKLLQDPSYRINPNAPEEPRLPSQIRINQPIAPPSPMPDVRVSMLMQLPYEEIVDPSHPFSPRWDFEDNDRDMFASQGANVFCAGDKDDKVIKVDILSFRDQRIGFTKHVQDRVSFNKNCMSNSGMQKNPCCKVIPNPSQPPQTWPCIPQPCSVCFGASEDSPACAVSYTGTPDRKTVVPPFLPVNPVLRIGGTVSSLGSSLQSINLSSLPSDLNVNQVRGMIGNVQGVMNSVPGGTPVSAMAGQLRGYANMAGNLQQMASKVGVGNLSSVMNSQGQIFSNMSNLNLNAGDLSAMMRSQASTLSRLPPQVGMGQYASYLRTPANLLGRIDSLKPDMSLANAAPTLRAGQAMLNAFPGTQNVGQVAGQLSGAARTLQNVQPMMGGIGNVSFEKAGEHLKAQSAMALSFSESTTVSSAVKQLKDAGQSLNRIPDTLPIRSLGASVGAKIPGLPNVAAQAENMTVGQLRQSMNAQVNHLSGMVPTSTMRMVAPQIASDVRQAIQLPRTLPGLEKAATSLSSESMEKMVSSYAEGLQTIDPKTPMRSVAPTINAQINGVLGLPPGMRVNVARDFLQNQSMSFQGLSNINPQRLGAGIESQTSALGSTISNFNPASLGSMFTSQGALINRFTDMPINRTSQILRGYTNNFVDIAKIQNISGISTSALQTGQMSAVLGTQLNQLQNFNGATSISTAASSVSSISGMGEAASPGNLTLGMVTSFPYSPIAACTPLEPAQNPSNMAKMCEQLRAPMIPINKLKMRYHDPEKLTESELPSGVPEGLTFKEYFGSNMPYIRLHDTGRPIQKSTSSKQDPMDDLGQYTAIVGVGREGVSGDAERKDERCLFGGWGGDASFGGVNISAPDPITSWTELKLYQTRTMRKDGLYCIGRYDKVFKPESTEEKLLGLAGGEFNAMRPLPGATEQTRMSQVSWPLAWRGYTTEPDENQRFPNFGGTASGILTGLDNARLGDILILDENGSAEGSKPGLPRLAVVVEGSNNDPQTCQSEGSCWVNIQAADDGGSPDICGGTDAMGQVLTRTFYKPSASTDLDEGPFGILGISTDCEDQNLQRCVLQRWDQIKVYRIREDRRTPQNAQPASGG